jgi:IS5 family transposase
MLMENYESVNLFDIVPLEHDPVLDELDRLLEEDALFLAVKANLARRYPHTLTQGRHSTPVEVILHMLAAKHLYQSYEEAESFIADSLTLRQFCRVYLNPVPDRAGQRSAYRSRSAWACCGRRTGAADNARIV